VRKRIDRALAAWGHFAYRHAWPVIACVLLVVAALGSQLPRLEFDTSTESFLHEDDPLRITYDEFREQFGRDDQVVIAIETADVFDAAFLDKLRALHEDVEDEVPSLEEVTSLINARNTRGEGDRLIVGELLEERPETPEALAEVERLARANPAYRDLLISENARYATVLIRTSAYSSLGEGGDELAGFDDFATDGTDEPAERPFLTGAENTAVVKALEAIVARYDADDFRIYLSGTPTMVEAMQRAMLRDMLRFTGLAVLTIVIFLALLFRRAAGVVLPMLTVILSLTGTLSIMAMAETPITLPTQILPSFLLAVGVGYSVHVLAIFYQHRRKGKGKQESIAFALGHSGLAILMTSLTTAGGLASFAAAELGPIADFGVFGPTGVLMALVFTMVLLPALTAVVPMGAKRAKKSSGPFSQRLLVRTGEFANNHAPSIAFATAGLLAIALLGAFQLRFSHDPLKWFPEDDYVRISNDKINEELKGAVFMEALVDTGEENGVQQPDLLARMDELRRYASALQFGDIVVGKTVSLVDVVKETNRALNENRDEFYTIPEDPQLVAQELLLFENSGSDDLEDLVDARFSMARMTFKVSMADGIQYQGFIAHMQKKFSEILGEDVELTLTGLMVIIGGTINAVIRSMAKTYIIALSIITPLLVILIGRLRLGLVAMIPNLTPIIFTLGLMGWVGIPLDAFTLLVGSIAIGLAVDDTIHFMHHFGRYFEASGDVGVGIRETLQSTGQALLYTTLVLSAGFFIYMFASMSNLFYFGFLTGLTIIMAFLADVILAPALITLVARPEGTTAIHSEVRSEEMEATT
jgi:predicted RND superfamily exporter protein